MQKLPFSQTLLTVVLQLAKEINFLSKDKNLIKNFFLLKIKV
jgi:hypothetical protein